LLKWIVSIPAGGGGGGGAQDMLLRWDGAYNMAEAMGFAAFWELEDHLGNVYSGSLTFLQEHSTSGFYIGSGSGVTAVNFPNLLDCDPAALSGNGIVLSGLPALTSALLDKLTAAGSMTLTTLPMLPSLSFPSLVTCPGVFIHSNAALTSISLPVFTSSATFSLYNNPSLVSVDLGALQTFTTDRANFFGNTSLPTLDLPSLVTAFGGLDAHGDASLTVFNAPLWVPTDGTQISFAGCALDAASIEQILSRCVAAGVTTCTIDLSGGSNAGLASLSAQGQTDAATLGGQLTINP